jgi:glycosyltransferase involved in cell wall biosynthesis
MNGMKRLAIVTTHPVQYHVPWLIRLAEKGIQLKVFYTWEQARNGIIYDPGFGRNIQWDIPLLEGYDYQFVKNITPRPGTHHFWGIINPGLNKEIEAWNPDCLLVFGWNFYSHLQCMRYFHKKIPILFRGDSVLLHEGKGIRTWARRAFLTWVYRHVDYALYVGTHNKSYFLKHGLRPSQLVYTPHAIDVDRFSEPGKASINDVQTWKKELGIPADHISILYAGKLTRVKNPSFIIDLAEACKGLPVSFILVGNGHLKAGLQQRSKDNRQVIFLDFQNQTMMPLVYRLGDILIMPSIKETWGLAISEAMACGRPVMASEKVGCAVDLVQEYKTGISFGVRDIDACVRFLKYVCEDRSRLTEMGINSSNLIKQFTFTHIVDSIRDVLATIKK